MSESVLLPENIEKITSRDGVPHSITEFDPASTALLVIDMQNFYMVEGQITYCPSAHAIVPNINRLVGAMRRFGGKVIWLRNLTNPETFRSWSTHYGRMKPEIIDHRKRGLAKDSHGFQLWHELDARDEDLWVEKTRYSAFIEGASNISKLLWTHGIDTLLLCGVEALNVKPFDVLSNFVPGGATRPVASRESRSSSSAEICSEILNVDVVLQDRLAAFWTVEIRKLRAHARSPRCLARSPLAPALLARVRLSP